MELNNISSHILCKDFCKRNPGTSYMDSNDILWKWVDGEWIGKPSIRDPNYKGFRYIWEDEITTNNLKTKEDET